MSDAALPEPDRVEGAAHPREVARVFGQEAAEATFLDAHASCLVADGAARRGQGDVGLAHCAVFADGA